MAAVAGMSTTPGAPSARPKQAKLRDACEGFEAIFLTLLFREMKATAPREGLLSGDVGGEIFDAMWVEELARAGARSSPLGIADMLYGKLSEMERG